MNSCLLSNSRFAIAFGLVAALVAQLSSNVHAHVLADGVVERGVEVQVFEDHIHVKYLVGLNDATLAALFAEDDIAQSTLAAKYAADAEAVDAAREQISLMLRDKLKVNVGGQVLELRPETNLNAGLHHMRFEFTYVAPINAAATLAEIQITDENFVAAPGSHRVALKGRLGVKVIGANTEPILARIERLEWESLSADEKREATHIVGRFAVVNRSSEVAEK